MSMCLGICNKHGKQCLVATDPEAVRNANYVNKKLCGRTTPILIKNGVIVNRDHRHVCEDCLMEGR